MSETPRKFSDDWIVVAQVVGVLGIKGELKLRPEDNEPDWLDSDCPLFFKKPRQEPVEHEVLDYRWKGNQLIVSVAEIPDRNIAETYVGACMCIKPEDLPEPEDNAYRISDLMGLRVVGKNDGQLKGTVTGLLSANGGDFLEIQLPDSEQKVVVSFQEAFFPVVNLEAKEIHLDQLPDLLALVPDPGEETEKPERPFKKAGKKSAGRAKKQAEFEAQGSESPTSEDTGA